ncbi:hypothetical protein SAMD00023353_7000570 [Rosellinia necatrix]|uniref:Uncharacterized protein n=1 Tax=Rosellinia necatrix TaxID=77044 RepID=A0A1S8ABN4_ROSNE|nr:hypothetical protein SAMD00023353_7000570 [Rosellinia necatrix]
MGYDAARQASTALHAAQRAESDHGGHRGAIVAALDRLLADAELNSRVAEVHGENITLRPPPRDDVVDEDSRHNLAEFSKFGAWGVEMAAWRGDVSSGGLVGIRGLGSVPWLVLARIRH